MVAQKNLNWLNKKAQIVILCCNACYIIVRLHSWNIIQNKSGSEAEASPGERIWSFALNVFCVFQSERNCRTSFLSARWRHDPSDLVPPTHTPEHTGSGPVWVHVHAVCTSSACLCGFLSANCLRVEVRPVLITADWVRRVLASVCVCVCVCVCGFNERWTLLTKAFPFNKRRTELPSPRVVESRAESRSNEIWTGEQVA